MTKYKWLCVLLFLGIFLMAIVPSASGADKEDFYWKNSYGRGVGTIPGSHVCTNGKKEDAGLCYKPCKAGYHGVGPVCWQNKASYGRGAGTIPGIHGCKKGKEKQAGLCYEPCKAGYHGKGPVCWENGPKSYGRGAGTPLVSVCKTGKEADGGLCYPKCKSGFHGIGPVCWGNTPSGYVDCAAGFAKDKATCAEITASQVAAVGMLFLPEAKAAYAAKKAKDSEKEIAEANRVSKALEPLLTKFKETFKNAKTSKPGTMMSKLKKTGMPCPRRLSKRSRDLSRSL